MATIKSKQLKRSYKVPRSLKKSIKQNLNKIVKNVKTRERKIYEQKIHEECTKVSQSHLFEACGFLDILDEVWRSHHMDDELRHTLRLSFERFGYAVGAEASRQKNGLEGQKAFTGKMLEKKDCLGEEVLGEIRSWLIEQNKNADEVEVLGKQDEHEEEEEEDNASGAVEEYDWTSTSTLE
ncbi:unnamed protein product [Aureobasidium uvarum]|uniref:Uncharacterized protein n=1 Tax=Aureobasidium uvarum TaxID=2773716 RepID=A0A9N8PW63_9PEZI|nr:unnamed protein product [Aureobasidium uvarum]